MHLILSNGWLQLFVVVGGYIIPLVVDLVTKSTTNPKLKAFLNLVLTAIGAFIAAAIAANGNGGLDVQTWLWTWVPTFIVSIAALFGLQIPTGQHAAAKQALTG